MNRQQKIEHDRNKKLSRYEYVQNSNREFYGESKREIPLTGFLTSEWATDTGTERMITYREGDSTITIYDGEKWVEVEKSRFLIFAAMLKD